MSNENFTALHVEDSPPFYFKEELPVRKKSLTGISVLLATLISSSIWFTTCTDNRKQNDPGIRIGAVLPLTGQNAQYGLWTQQGIDMAVDEINTAAGTNSDNKIQILYQDSAGDPKTGVTATQQLISTQGIKFLIVINSGVVVAAAPIAESNHVILMNPAAANAAIRKAGDYIFSNINDAKSEANFMAKYMKNTLNIDSAAILNATSAYQISAADAFEEQFKALGGKIVAHESFDENATEVRTQLTKLRSTNVNAVYTPAISKNAALILRQAQELGFKPKWFSATAFEGPEVQEIAGSADGVIYTSSVLNKDDPQVKEFMRRFQERYGKDPEVYSATAYDAVHILYSGIQKGGYNPDRVKDYLYTLKNFPGPSGPTTFEADGGVSNPIVLKVVRNGQFQILPMTQSAAGGK
jgi:branched-chain amino acid transport system substrate-binding protein